MTGDDLDFLRAICANPADDATRLVYADWLDDHGDAPRAAFIRAQVERAAAGGRRLSFAEYELLAEHEPRWRDELPPGLRSGVTYRRGFPYRLRGPAGALVAAWRAGAVLPPVEVLEITVDDASTDWLDLPRPAVMPPLRQLAVRCQWPIGSLAAQLIVSLGPYPHLEMLTLIDPALGDAAADYLRPAPTFPAVTALELPQCGIGDAGADALADAWAGRLTRLVLTGNPIGRRRAAHLRARLAPAAVVV